MRTSLLLAREPFGQIACKTLANYWRARTGKDYHVEWHDRNPGKRFLQRRSLQGWFGNIYLNFFAVNYAPDEAFEPLRQEYIRSVSRWRRWPQRAYVNYAMSRAGRKRLVQAAISVWPGVHDAHDCIILGGNRRLRLLQPARRTTTVVLKHGFVRGYLTEDARVRLAAGDALSCAPRIGRHSLEEGWYEEEWVTGVPVNRLDWRLAQTAIESGHLLLASQLVHPTLQEDNIQGYLDVIAQRILAVQKTLYTGDAELGDAIRSLQEQLVSELRRAGADAGGMATAATHGDLQPANLLWDGSLVRIIDWENSRRRIAGYDMLFHAIGMTTRTHWSHAFTRLLHTPREQLPGYMRDWPGLDWTTNGRKVTLILFLLEQLATVLEEDCEPVFFHPGRAFLQRLSQFRASVRALAIA